MADPEVLAVLHIRFPDGSDHTVEIQKTPFNIGRGGDNQLQLPDPKISRNHARLLFEGGEVVLIDLKSSNGTFLGEERLTPNQPYPLGYGQGVNIGPYFLALEKPAPKAPRKPPKEPEKPEKKARSEAEAEPPEPPAAREAEPEPQVELEPEPEPEPAPDKPAEPEPEPEAEPKVKIGTQPVPQAAKGENELEAETAPPEPPIGPPSPPEPPGARHPEPTERDPLFGVPADRSRYLDFLPPIYEGEPFLGRFLLAFEGLLTPIEQTVDNFDLYLDPGTTPSSFLEQLAYWLGLSLDEKWSDEKRRAVVSEAAELHRRRGTAWSLRRHLEIYTGVTPEITESKEQPHHFEVSLRVPRGAEVDRDTVDRIIRSNKPAHTSYDLEISRGGGRKKSRS